MLLPSVDDMMASRQQFDTHDVEFDPRKNKYCSDIRYFMVNSISYYGPVIQVYTQIPLSILQLPSATLKTVACLPPIANTICLSGRYLSSMSQQVESETYYNEQAEKHN